MGTGQRRKEGGKSRKGGPKLDKHESKGTVKPDAQKKTCCERSKKRVGFRCLPGPVKGRKTIDGQAIPGGKEKGGANLMKTPVAKAGERKKKKVNKRRTTGEASKKPHSTSHFKKEGGIIPAEGVYVKGQCAKLRNNCWGPTY